jgi:hypothetical protein
MLKADNVAFWELRAEEAQTVAEVMVDEQAAQTMLKMAEGYDRLAQLARERIEAERTAKVIPFKRTGRSKAG